MQLDLKRTVDPRDNLDKAHKRELIEWAHKNGMNEITEAMPADDVDGRAGTGIRGILRAKGFSRIPIPHRSINTHGTVRTHALQQKQAVVPASSDEWAEFQEFKRWKAAQSRKPPADKPVTDMTITELRQACKTRGIKLARTDNMETMRAKLGQNPA